MNGKKRRKQSFDRTGGKKRHGSLAVCCGVRKSGGKMERWGSSTGERQKKKLGDGGEFHMKKGNNK